MNDAAPHVVILGGGFGGLYAAKTLARDPVRITLVDRTNHHLFQPLLYQVATAALNPADIGSPIRSVLRRQRNASVVLAEATAIDAASRRVTLRDGAIDYDYLEFVATGATHSYFGHEDWAAHAPGLKTIEDALNIRRRIFLAYEAAEREPDPEQRRAYLTFVVVGGGATGVETAGALAEIARHTLPQEFRVIDPTQARVILIEALPRLLSSYPPQLSAKTRSQLERIGVQVWTNGKVTGVDERGVSLGEERVAARTVIWAAGVRASPLAGSLGVELDRAGRVLVTPRLTLPGHEEVFVIGDLAAVRSGASFVPGVSPAAIQMGRHAALAIRRALRGQPAPDFRYRDRGSFATIGRGAAVGDLYGRIRLWGFPAWTAWLAIHIFFLIGFRNRLLVLFQWAYSYFTYRRGVRLIEQGGAVVAPLEPPLASRE